MHRTKTKTKTKAISRPTKKMCCCDKRMARMSTQHK